MTGYLICEGYGSEQTVYAAYGTEEEVIEETQDYIEFHNIDLEDYVEEKFLHPTTLKECAKFWEAQGGFLVKYEPVLDHDIDI